ncbi:probable uridine nucleosidase 1 isoform X3 [Siniperca chuatsi]|uniref:probable uridine nucleosidase 1 isoform X3 n=1 Tax=Siniperca chuatsi TaxID=119488 RepID=UPI001CE1CDFC|nr:probable uridine nucleosidase 1 isoform X3 [Siniperca chuatsi]
MAKKQVIIDTDCGIDDAQAIMMALAAPNIQIVGVTCVFGNAAVENVCQNVLRVLSICEREGIPVFQGAGGPLVGASNPLSDHFGSDGLGDVIENKDPQWEEKIQSEHAVNAMIRLVTENQKQVSLVALGPLTNLALAVRLDPCFPQKLKDLYIMGGNMEGIGNVTLCAEFNFAKDPESAYIVLEEFLCPTYLASWEYSCRNALTWLPWLSGEVPSRGLYYKAGIGVGEATCDHHCMVTSVDVKWPGSVLDSALCHRFEKGLFLGELLGDRACQPFLMTPYPDPDAAPQNRFNVALTKTRVRLVMIT